MYNPASPFERTHARYGIIIPNMFRFLYNSFSVCYTVAVLYKVLKIWLERHFIKIELKRKIDAILCIQ